MEFHSNELSSERLNRNHCTEEGRQQFVSESEES
jgi:hypothetical protein